MSTFGTVTIDIDELLGTDDRPARGYVTFTPSTTYNPDVDGQALVIREVIKPLGKDVVSVQLLAGIVWTATFARIGADIEPITFELEDGETIDIATVTPPTSEALEVTVLQNAGQKADKSALDAESAARAAADTAINAELDGRLSEESLNSAYAPVPSATPPASPAVGQLWYSNAFEHVRPPTALQQRQAVITQTGSWEGAALQEPSVWIYDNQYRVLFTAGTGLGYATCPITSDPTDPANWSRPASYSAPILAGIKHASIYIEGSTIHLYGIDQATSTKVMYATASITTAVPSFTTPVQVMSLPSGSTVFGNTRVVKDGSTYYMMIEHKITATGRWQMSWATTSTVGGTWTITVNTLQTLWPGSDRQTTGGAWLVQENGVWVLWYHAGINWNGGLPSDIYRATAPSLGADNFTMTDYKQPIVTRRNTHEVDQVADVDLIRAPDGTVYAFWVGMHNRGASYPGKITVAKMLPTMMRWDGNRWKPDEAPLENGTPITVAQRPRVAIQTANFQTASADGATWEDITGLFFTHAAVGTDVEVEFRCSHASSGSVGFRYEYRVVRAGSDNKQIGASAGSAGNPSSFCGVAVYTQLTPGVYYGYKVQVKVPSGGGTWYCRPVSFADREFGTLKITDIQYP